MSGEVPGAKRIAVAELAARRRHLLRRARPAVEAGAGRPHRHLPRERLVRPVLGLRRRRARLDGWYTRPSRGRGVPWPRRNSSCSRDPPSVVISTAATLEGQSRTSRIVPSSTGRALKCLSGNPLLRCSQARGACVGRFRGYAGCRRQAPAGRLVGSDLTARGRAHRTAARRARARLHGGRLTLAWPPRSSIAPRIRPDAARPRRAPRGVDVRGAVPGAGRGSRRRRRLAPLRLRRRDDGALGWQAARARGVGTFTQLLQHRPPIRVVYNASVFGGAAALAASRSWLDTQTVGGLVAGGRHRRIRRLLGQPAC